MLNWLAQKKGFTIKGISNADSSNVHDEVILLANDSMIQNYLRYGDSVLILTTLKKGLPILPNRRIGVIFVGQDWRGNSIIFAIGILSLDSKKFP